MLRLGYVLRRWPGAMRRPRRVVNWVPRVFAGRWQEAVFLFVEGIRVRSILHCKITFQITVLLCTHSVLRGLLWMLKFAIHRHISRARVPSLIHRKDKGSSRVRPSKFRSDCLNDRVCQSARGIRLQREGPRRWRTKQRSKYNSWNGRHTGTSSTRTE